MTRPIEILVRCTLIVLAYAGAVTMAGFVLLIAMLGIHAEDFGESRPAFLFTLAMTSIMIGYWAFLPAMAIIILGEGLRKRDWLFYSLGGAIAAIAILAWRQNWADDMDFALAVIAAGLAGGWAYWLIAGRSAARWLPEA